MMSKSQLQEWAKAYGPDDDCIQIAGLVFKVNVSAKTVAKKINTALAATYQKGKDDEYELLRTTGQLSD